MIAAVPLMSVPKGQRGAERGGQRRPPSCKHLPQRCRAACLPAVVAKFTPPLPKHPQDITLGFYYSLASLHTESHVKVSHKPLRLAVPFPNCIRHSVHLMPFVSTQLPDRSLTRSPSLHLYSSSLILAPSMARLSTPPPLPNLQLQLLSS